jgi:ribosomal protein L37AE/L43A
LDDRDFEDYLVLDEIIQQVCAGKLEGHKCPFCNKADLKCAADDLTVRIECPACGKFFEGTLA